MVARNGALGAALLATLLSAAGFAAPPSILGGKRLGSGTAHHVGIGTPSLFYEWWNAGSPDWALGAELVYGEWSGAFTNVDVGLGLNAPMRYPLGHRDIWDWAFKVAPGLLIADVDGRRNDDRFMVAARGDLGVLVTAALEQRVNLVTGGAFPLTIAKVEDSDPYFVVPILGRIGVEVVPAPPFTVWLLVEVGPTVAFNQNDAELDPGIRIWAGGTIW